MNKFTLRFLDKSLEIEYQTIILKFHNQLFTWISIFSALSSLLLILNSIVDNDYHYLSLRIATLSFIVFQAAIVRYFPRIINYGMIGINLCLIKNFLYYYDIDPIHIYIRAQNQMGITTIILFLTDFQLGIINNFLLLTIRIFLLYYYAISSNIIDIIYMILVQTCLLICLYYKNLYQRRFYLITMRDNSYEQMIPQNISKPFFLFRFDQNSLQFTPIRTELKHFLQNVESPLKYFLRTAQYHKISLESYLFRKNQGDWRKQVANSSQTLQITFLKQTKVITLSQLALEVQTFIIIVDDEDCNSHLVKQSYQNRLNNQYIIQRRFIQQQINLLKKINKKLKLGSLAKLYCQYIQILLLFDIKKNCSQLLNKINLMLIESSRHELQQHTFKFYPEPMIKFEDQNV